MSTLESDDSIIERPGVGKIGSVREKGDLWALCTLDNQTDILNTGVANPERIRTEVLESTKVLVRTVTGDIPGIIGDYSIVAPPGSRVWHRMWTLTLEDPLCE